MSAPNFRYAIAAYYLILPAEASSNLAKFDSVRFGLRVTPAGGFAIQQTLPRYPQVLSVYEPSTGYYPLAPWSGLAVLCGYAALAWGLAVWRLRGRDV